MRFLISGMVASLFLLFAAPASAQVGALARRLPASSNAMMIVHVDQVLASPIAKANDWKFKLAKARMEGVSVLSPEAKTAVFGIEFDLEVRTQLHEAVVMELDEDPNLEGLANRVHGELDKFGAYQAVALPGDAFVVNFGSRRVAAIAPGNRQMVARWVRETESRTASGLGDYLNKVLERADAAPITLALDLDHAVTARHVHGVLETLPAFKSRANIDALAASLASIRGVSLAVSFGENTTGKLTVDFAQAVDVTPADAKLLLLDAIGRNGLMLDEFADWQPAVSGQQISLSGELGPSGRKRIFSLFSPPPAIKQPPVEGDGATTQSTAAHASQQYFRHIADLLKDLRLKKTDTSSAQTMGQWASWYESYARRIDQLPVLNVDPELVSFAGYAAQSLRNACQSLRTGAANSRTRQVNVKPVYNTYTHSNVYGYSYRWDGSGGPVGTTSSVSVYDKYAVQQERTIARTEERIGAYGSANEIMQKVDQSLGEMRQKMTAKYRLEF